MRFIVLCAAAALALGEAIEARTTRVNRRDVWNPSDPLAFELALGFDPVGRYVTTIGMGNPWAKVGNFSFLLSTSSPYTAVAAVGCTTCAAQTDQSQVFNISRSSSASPRGTTQAFNIGKGSISGQVIRESCILTKTTDSKWVYDNQTIILVESAEGVFSKGSSGLLGLGRSSGNDSYTTGILQSRGWSKVLLGLALNPYNSTADTTAAKSAGSFTVRELNRNLFNGSVSWQPIAKVTDVPSNVPTDWALIFDSYQISSGYQSTVSTGGVAIIEPYFPELRIPSGEAMDFFNKFPSAKMTNDSTTLSWVVPCDQDVSLAVTIEGTTYRVKQEQLVSPDPTGTVCTSLVRGWADPSIRTYLFGTPFATSAYIAYNAMLDPSYDQIGVARRAEDTAPIIIQHPGLSGQTVVASVVGSIVGVATVAALLFLFIRWRRREPSDKPPKKPRFKKQKYIIEPFTGGTRHDSLTPLISVIGGQDLWLVEQGEIGGEPSARYPPMREQWSMQTTNGLSPLVADRKSPLPTPSSPHLILVRQSQLSNSSHSPEPSPQLDMHARVSSQARLSLPDSQPYERPDIIPDGLAPPPYEREQARRLLP